MTDEEIQRDVERLTDTYSREVLAAKIIDMLNSPLRLMGPDYRIALALAEKLGLTAKELVETARRLAEARS